MKKHILMSLVFVGLISQSAPISAESMFERKMAEAGQNLQKLNNAFREAMSNLRNKVQISPQTWNVIKNSAKALVGAIIVAAGAYFTYKLVKRDTDTASPAGLTHQERFSVGAMKKRYGISGDQTFWEKTLLESIERSVHEQNPAFSVMATLAEIKSNNLQNQISNKVYNAVRDWAAAKGFHGIRDEVTIMMTQAK